MLTSKFFNFLNVVHSAKKKRREKLPPPPEIPPPPPEIPPPPTELPPPPPELPPPPPWACTTEECVAKIVLTYPPGFYFMEKIVNLAEILSNCPLFLTLHGLYEPRKLRPMDKNKYTREDVIALEFDEDLMSKIELYMPQLGVMEPQERMKYEINKHGEYLSGFTIDSIAPFVIQVYERFGFYDIMDFIVMRILQVERNAIPIWGQSWVPVTLAEFEEIANSYPLLHEVQGNLSLLNTKLIRKGGRLFLYEIILCVNKHGMPSLRSSNTVKSYVVMEKNEAKNLPPETIFHIMYRE